MTIEDGYTQNAPTNWKWYAGITIDNHGKLTRHIYHNGRLTPARPKAERVDIEEVLERINAQGITIDSPRPIIPKRKDTHRSTPPPTPNPTSCATSTKTGRHKAGPVMTNG